MVSINSETDRRDRASAFFTRIRWMVVGPVPLRLKRGSMSIGDMLILPDTLSGPQMASGMPVTIFSLPSLAQPAMSAMVQPHRVAVSYNVKNALGGNAISVPFPVLSRRRMPPGQGAAA